MASYRQLKIELGDKGINLARRADELEIGESAEANNVEFFADTVTKRNGYINVLTGNYDSGYYGGAPSQSLYLVPEEWWITSPYEMTWARTQPSFAPPVGSEVDGRRDFFNQRPSFITIPEGNTPGIRLDCQDADPSWAIEFCINADEIPIFHQNGSINSALMTPIVAQKGSSLNGQWAVRLIPDATSTDRFYAVLTLYEGGALNAGTDFFYSSGAARAWIEPGKRTWLAWKFIKGAPGTITSYYYTEGAGTVVSSSQNLAGTLRTNGVGTATYPITIGRRPYQGAVNNGIAGGLINDIAFLGSMSEMRFWLETAQGAAGTLELPSNWATVTAAPPTLTDWYVEREIPQEQLTTDASVEASNLVQTTDLQLYFQFKPELVGYQPNGTAISGEQNRMLRPRFTRGTATDNIAWISGADATWIPATGTLGNFALALIPPCGVAGQEYVFADTVRSGNSSGYHGNRLFAGGIRIPNASSYMAKATTGSATAFQFPDEFQVRVAHRVDALPVNTGYEETLVEMCSIRKGGVGVEDRYSSLAVFRISVVFNGANWVYGFLMTNELGANTLLLGTTVVTAGATHVVQAAVKYDATRRTMSLFVDGNREATGTGAGAGFGKPLMSQPSSTDITAPNKDDDDGRDQLFPFHIGYSVEMPTALTPNPWTWRCGAWGIGGGGVGYLGTNRSYWAFHTNDTQKTPNDGVGYRGTNPLVGAIGSVQVWQKYSSENEARALATRPPNSEEMQRDGARLLSNWDMEEGSGVMAYDKGFLKNHLRINPYPTAKIASGVLDRVEKPPILGIWQQRQTSTSGALTQNIYAMSHGTLLQATHDSQSNLFLKPVGKCQTPEMWKSRSTSLNLPTSFQFNSALYVCTGLGAVKCLRDGKLSDAGLTPVFGNIGDDQTNLGWREFDRDGVLQPYVVAQENTTSPANFPLNTKFGWCITHYDPVLGLESAPSRPIYLTADSGTYGWKAVAIRSMPHPMQRQASKIRLYRTTSNGGVFKLISELPADFASNFSGYLDSNPDTKLSSVLDSWLNYPPPQNARIGLAFGTRVLYFGVSDRPDTLFYSLQGQPGACPPQYQIQIASGQSTELTAGVVINDRAFIFTRTSTYAVFDSGGDIAIDSQTSPPVQIYQLRDDLGCISHHGIVTIEGFGAIIPTERGLFLFDGNVFRNLGGEQEDRIQPFWEEMNLSVSKNFVAAAHRRKKQYILYCSTHCSPGSYNDRALVYDWGRNAFSIQTQKDVVSAGTVVDEATGQERIWVGTLNGNIFEYDPPEATIFCDGVVAAPYSGTIQAVKKDPLGSGKYTRLRLVTNGSLTTSGDGLRGVNLYTTNGGTQWHTLPLKILWNDGDWVLVDATAANTTDPTGFEWRLGPIGADWASGKLNFGSDVDNLRVLRVQYKMFPSPGTTLVTELRYDEQAFQGKFADPAKDFAILSGIRGRGKRAQLRMHDITRFGGVPNNPWACSRLEIDWQERGRSTYVPS